MRRVVLFGLLLLVVISLGCLQNSINNVETCESKAMKLFPDSIDIQVPSEHLWIHSLSSGNWKDGTELSGIVHWEWGYSTGQNVNYLYPKDGVYEASFGVENGLHYSKRIVSSDGNILGFRTFKVLPALKPIKGTEYVEPCPYCYQSAPKYFQKFEIVEPMFWECNWIDDPITMIEKPNNVNKPSSEAVAPSTPEKNKLSLPVAFVDGRSCSPSITEMNKGESIIVSYNREDLLVEGNRPQIMNGGTSIELSFPNRGKSKITLPNPWPENPNSVPCSFEVIVK